MSAEQFKKVAEQLDADRMKPHLLTKLKAIHNDIINQYKCKYEALLIISDLYFTSSTPWNHPDMFTFTLNNMSRLDDNFVTGLIERHDWDISLCEQRVDKLLTMIKSEKARLDDLIEARFHNDTEEKRIDDTEVKRTDDTNTLLLEGNRTNGTAAKLQQKEDELAECKKIIKLMRKHMCDDNFIEMLCCVEE